MIIMAKYLQQVHDQWQKQLRDNTTVRLLGETPHGWDRGSLENLLTEQQRESVTLVFTLSTQISLLADAFGYDEPTYQALLSVATKLQADPKLTPGQAYKKPRWFWQWPIITSAGERRLYDDPQYAEEIFGLYKSRIEPELIATHN
jgi:hypothetical protein